MTMSNAEQNAIFQALKGTGGEGVLLVKTQDGVNVYYLCKLVPVKQFTAAEASAYATAIGQSIASP